MAVKEQPKRDSDRVERSQVDRGATTLQRPAETYRGLSRDPWEWGTSSSPFAMLRRFSEDMDRIFGEFGRGWPMLWEGSQSAFQPWSPEIEVFQRGSELVVRADIPGVKKEDLNVTLREDALTIEGERHEHREEEREDFYRSERHFGSFHRVIPLPEGTIADSAKASFKDGVLEIVMQAPSKDARRGRRLEISEQPK